MSKMVCSDPACGWVGKEGETLEERREGVGGTTGVCPRCKTATALRGCDAEGCAQPARWIVESPEYRMTCRVHAGVAGQDCAGAPR